MSGPELKIIILLLLAIPGQATLTGQSSRTDPRLQEWKAQGALRDSLDSYILKQFGPNQVLLNGYQYYEEYRRYKGNPYLAREDFFTGSVSRSGQNFEGLQLKYDCFAQLIVVEFSQTGTDLNRVMINNTDTDSFRVGDMHFIKTSLNGESEIYYQVIEADPLTCYVHWEKELIPLSNDLRYPYEFSRSKALVFVRLEHELQQVQGRKAFSAMFPGELSTPLRKYYRRNQFRFSNAGPEALTQLIRFAAGELKKLQEL